jgi:hypothetical protein
MDDGSLYDYKLKQLERAFADGNHTALGAAVKVCDEAKRPLPKWVCGGVLLALNGKTMNTGRGRTGNPDTKVKQDRIHFTRWDVVRELRDRREELAPVGYKPTWEAAYENASKSLKGTEAQGEPAAIAASYKKIERIFRRGGGARFYQTGE